MARGQERRGSFRAAVLRNASQQRSKAANYGHLLIPKGVSVFKEEAGGRINLDILPYFVTDRAHPDRDEEFGSAVEGTMWYRRPYKIHRQIGAKSESVVCPSSFGKKCPICEYRTKLMGEGADWKDKSVTALRAGNRCLYYVVPKGSSKHDERPYIWDISEFCFQDMLNNELGENEEFGDFAQLDVGLTLKIRFSEEKLDRNSFAKTSRIDFERRDYEYDEKVVRELASLDDCLDAKEYREVERLFYDTEEVDEDEVRAERAAETDQDRVTREDNAEQTGRATPSLTRPKSGNGAASPPTRVRPEPEPEREPEREIRRPAVAATKPKPTLAKNDAAGECPSGYVFGNDVDKHDECGECKIWDKCMDAHDAAAA